MRIITIEEHIPGSGIAAAAGLGAAKEAPCIAHASGRGLPYVPDGSMFDICEKRVTDMDKHGIDMQVVSCASQSQYIPAKLAPAIVKGSNDELAAAISKYPARFAAFAALPWSNPEKAAQELERAVSKLGFKGAILAGSAGAGKGFLDAPKFTPVLEAAQELNVPRVRARARTIRREISFFILGFLLFILQGAQVPECTVIQPEWLRFQPILQQTRAGSQMPGHFLPAVRGGLRPPEQW